MSESQSQSQSQGEAAAVVRSFAEHVRAFHRSLPAEEQVLLEEVFELAEQARIQDTEGHLLPAHEPDASRDAALKIAQIGDRALKINELGALWSNPLR